MLTKSLLAFASIAISALACTPPAGSGFAKAAPPTSLFIYNVGTGAITPSNAALVDKSPVDGGQDRTTLMTFNDPSGGTSNNCLIFFDPSDPSLTATGSRKLDLFTSNAPAPPGGNPGWGPPGNQRNNQLVRWTVAPGSVSTDATYGSLTFACNSLNNAGFEIVGVYDTDTVSYKTFGVCVAYN
ncbi:hypothetical protein MANI_018961 [Metarhizium anisopliae]